jgi:hypothetical protein
MLYDFSEPVKAFIGPLSGAHSPRAKFCNVEAQRGRRENAKNALDFSHPAKNAAMKPEKYQRINIVPCTHFGASRLLY